MSGFSTSFMNKVEDVKEGVLSPFTGQTQPTPTPTPTPIQNPPPPPNPLPTFNTAFGDPLKNINKTMQPIVDYATYAGGGGYTDPYGNRYPTQEIRDAAMDQMSFKTETENITAPPPVTMKINTTPQPVEEQINRAEPVTMKINTTSQPIIQSTPAETMKKTFFYDTAGKQYDTVEKRDAANLKIKMDQAKVDFDKEQAGEFDTHYDKFIKFWTDLASGDDPLKQQQWNFSIQKLGSFNREQNDAMMMKMRQAGIDPNKPGAGWAMLNNLARSQNAEMSNIVNKLNIDSTQRILDANKYGWEKLMDLESHKYDMYTQKYEQSIKELNTLATVIKSENPDDYVDVLTRLNLPPDVDISKLINDVKNETVLDNLDVKRATQTNYKGNRDLLDSLAPGVNFNDMAFANLSSADYSSVITAFNNMNNKIRSGNVDGAREILKDLALRYPGVFNDNYDQWDPNNFDAVAAANATKEKQSTLTTMVTSAGIDTASLLDAAQWAVEQLVDKSTIDQEFNELWSTMSLYEKQKLMEIAGLDEDPLDADEKALILGAENVRSIQKNTDPTQQIFNSMVLGSPEIKTWLLSDPENEKALRSWIYDLQTQEGTIGPDGKIVVDPTKLLSPTNPQSDLAHRYLDWPYALDAEGNYLERGQWPYSGNNLKSDNLFDDPDYQSSMDAKWEDYRKQGGSLNRMDWFENSQSGTQKVEVVKVGEIPTPPDAGLNSLGIDMTLYKDLDADVKDVMTRLVKPGETIDPKTNDMGFSDIPTHMLTGKSNTDPLISELIKAGYIDATANITSLNELPSGKNITQPGDASSWAKSIGITQYPISDKVTNPTGSQQLEVNFVDPDTGKGATVLIGTKRYEFIGHQNYEYDKNHGNWYEFEDLWRRGYLWGYELDSNGNRIGDMKALSSGTQDI